MLFFGTGLAFINPTGGNQATNPSPVHIGTMQDISVTIDQATKELYGSYNVPDDVASGHMSISGKFSFARLDVDLFNNAMFGQATTTGVKLINTESHTVPSVTPWTVTVTNSATFATDLGVSYASGASFAKVASAPTVGQYSVASGVYTFATADANAAVVISYTSTSTTGKTLTISKQQLGWGPSFELYLENQYEAPGNGLHLYAAKIGKLAVPLKLDDYTKAEMDFKAYASSTGQIFDWYQVTG